MKNDYTILAEKEKENILAHWERPYQSPKLVLKNTMNIFLKKNITSIIPPILHNNIFVTDVRENCHIFKEYFKNQCKTINTSSTIPPHVIKSTDL